MYNRVLHIATSKKTRGGITAILKQYEKSEFWKRYNVCWVETHIDRSICFKILYALWGLYRYLLLLNSADMVHIHTSTPSSAKRKFVFFKLAKLFNKRVIIHLHIGSQIESLRNNKLYSILFSGADAVIVLSEVLRDKLVELFDCEDKVYVVYNPCESIDNIKYSLQNKQILFAGTLNMNKGYSDLLHAFSLVASKHPNWRLVFAGNGELANAINITKNLHIDESVDFPGWVTGSSKDSLFRNSGCLCLASYEEGFPMAVLDAWSYALPVICTPVGGLTDVVKDGENVLLFSPGDYESLASQLDRIMSDEHLRMNLSEKSYSLSQTNFSLREIDEKIQAIYKRILT